MQPVLCCGLAGATNCKQGTGARVPGGQQAGTRQRSRPQFGVEIGRQATEDFTARFLVPGLFGGDQSAKYKLPALVAAELWGECG